MYNVALKPLLFSRFGPRAHNLAHHCSAPNVTKVGQVWKYGYEFIYALKKARLIRRRFSRKSRMVEDFFFKFPH
jgi:hypothetical protein